MRNVVVFLYSSPRFGTILRSLGVLFCFLLCVCVLLLHRKMTEGIDDGCYRVASVTISRT